MPEGGPEHPINNFEIRLGNGVGVYALVNADKKTAAEFFKELKDSLGDNLYASLEHFRSAVASSEKFADVDYCIGAFYEQFLYALVGGGASLYINRDDKKMPLLTTLQSVSSLVSGRVRAGDVYVCETTDKNKLELTMKQETALEEAVEHEEVQEQFVPKKTGIREKLASVIDGLLGRLPERKIVIHGDDYQKSRAKKASLIGFVFLLILGVSIYFGLKQKDVKIAKEKYEPQLTQATHDLEEAISLSSLSDTRARELILTSRKEAQGLKDEGVDDPRLDELLSKISDNLGPIAGIYDEHPELFMDLSIVSSGFKGSDIALSEGLLRVLDTEAKKLVGIEVDNKRTEVIAGPDYMPNAISTIAYANRSFVLSSDGIREVTGEQNLVVKPDWDAKNVLAAAFSGNLYVLDRSGEQIWRYQGVTGGFQEKEAWLGHGFTIDLGNVVAWAIDGSIWTTDERGNVKIYALGAPATFRLTGEHDQFDKVVDIYTNEDSKFIYLLDSGRGSISVINKNGQYKGEYVADELKGANKMVVDEAEGIILFLSNSKLYKIQAKHLEL